MTAPLRRRRPLVLALVGLAYLGLLTWSTVTVAAGTGSSISVLCSSIEGLCRQWAEDFTAETGTNVTMVRLSTGEALARLSRPGGLREFDVWHGGTAESYVIAEQRGLLARFRSPESDAVPSPYKDPDGAWTGVYLGVLGFCSNAHALATLGLQPPQSWDDLLAPELQHLVSVPSPLTSGTGYTVVWTQRQRLGSDAAAIEYLKRLDANVLQYTNSGLAPAGIAGRGEAAVAITFSQHCLTAAGPDELVITYPREGTGFEIGAVAVLAGSRDPDAARRYVDYAVSRAGQSAGAATSPQLRTRTDLPATDPRLGSDAGLLHYTPADAAAERQRLTDEVSAQVLR